MNFLVLILVDARDVRETERGGFEKEKEDRERRNLEGLGAVELKESGKTVPPWLELQLPTERLPYRAEN